MSVRNKNVTAITKERRRYPRVMAPDRALVAVSDDYQGFPYNMIDISEGGLAFIYIGEDALTLTDKQLDIYLDTDLQVGRISVMVVADRQLEGLYIPKRQCSLRFGELSEPQREKLQMFINRHANAA